MATCVNGNVTECEQNDPLADISEVVSINSPSIQRSTGCGITANNSNRKPNHCWSNSNSLSLHPNSGHQTFECYVCQKPFSRKSNLTVHARSHSNTKPFRCNYCSLSFVRATELLKHSIFHTGDTRNQCRQCKLVLGSRERLEKHKKIHAVSVNYQCHMCGANDFESKRKLFSHIKVCDKKAKSSAVTCVNNNAGSDQLFDCEICKKQFRRKSNFMAHMKRHYGNIHSVSTEVKTHLCCICGKLFSHKTHLVRHLYIHNNGRPFKCEYCGADFTQRGGLIRHLEKHKTF